MIRFVLTKGHRYTMQNVRETRDPRPAVTLGNYEDLLHAQRLRPATYVFTDMDRLSYWDLERASRLYLHMRAAGFRVLNNPATVKQRYPLLRALHDAGLNDFNAYRAEELPAEMRFPVFLRREQGHGMPFSDLLHSRDDVLTAIDRAIAGGVPLASLIVIEYANEPVREGQFRKLSAFRIGGKIVPHFSVNDGQWLVKYGRMDPSIEDLYLDEQRMLETNPCAEHLQKVFDIAGIEYGRADFGLLKGRIQVYEINTNPHIPPPHKHPSATRMQNVRVAWEKYLAALRAIDSPSGPPVWFRRNELEPGILGVMKHDAVEENARLARGHEAQREHDSQFRLIENLQRAKCAIGATLDFTDGGNGDFYIRKGWCPPEPWGRWTAGGEAILHLRFKQPPARDICLTAFIKAFAPPLHAAVHVNGERLVSWELKCAAFRKFRAIIPHEKLLAGEAEIRFEILHPRSPKSLGMSQDARLLGLGFSRMRLDWNQGWRRLAPF